MPKKSSTYDPTSIDPVMSQNILTAIRRASSARVAPEAPLVMLKNIGAVAAGFRMGSIVTKTNRKLFAAARISEIVISQNFPCFPVS